MFRIGQKVQCWNDDWSAPCSIRKGRVLTISAITDGYSNVDCAQVLGLAFVEVPCMPGLPKGFNARRFRPLAEPKTDISIFRKALTGDLLSEEA